MNYVELFAGCGGLSLGLKSVGFQLVLANELSPMAAESYSFNLLNEDLKKIASSKKLIAKKTLWLNSQFPDTDLEKRLRENPKNFPPLSNGFTDIDSNGDNLKGSLVVGSIIDLNLFLSKQIEATSRLKSAFGAGGIDLVSGGPPCQSFSMAGLRQKDSEKNSLPWEFAKFTKTMQPKIVLLENVTGILRPFKDSDGKKYYAWFEVAKAFSEIGYIPLCLHINAKFVGVPQNRPRFILLGVRRDFFEQLSRSFNKSEKEIFTKPLGFFHSINLGKEVDLDSLAYLDPTKQKDLELFKNSFLNPLITHKLSHVTVRDAIDDLRTSSLEESAYVVKLRSTFAKTIPSKVMKNNEPRANGLLVQRRFRLYQILQELDNSTRRKILQVLKGDTHDISDDDWKKIQKFEFLLESGKRAKFKSKSDFLSFLDRHATKKQTQKALAADQPAPAALSIPDDACHYHSDELRTLTVREMARIQSFPDSFEFRSKVTTGGESRSFEVPQYTQVGNAVPPLLGRALGLVVSNLLSRTN